ncbi:LPS export ABC transporter permease LptG [Sphingomonas sabuli]|uniref:LPS export ABC transporter permease LptG n=1 Tax=Sphingomonas sabuli TaxID=2764186 RepID=A0A7G9L605_9SPHN|nr:LPS export ABC transporter permease LptG [Sphingomonas sabuli]QNM84054.1 LPS export ABC transporter permease LptG [Sphingomonas sabuli]
MNLQFFPSRRLALYSVKLYLTRTLAVLIGLVLVLLALDLLGESGKILGVPGNSDADLWRYAGLRLPLLIARFLPFSVLLGTLIMFVSLNQNSEVVAMKSAGVSAHQMLAPLVVASLGLSVAAFIFNETVTVQSARVVNAWSDNDYKPIPPESGILTNVWVARGEDLVRARHVGGTGRGFHAEGLTIYDRERGALARIVEAERAYPRDGDWQLQDVTVYDSGMNVVRRVPEMSALTGVTADQLRLSRVDPDETSFFDLKQKIEEMQAAGKPTAAAEAGLWHKLSGPLSIVLMPLLAAVAAFGLARSGQVLLRATIGMALGFAYFVADNFSLAMGNVGAYPPLLAAWAPFFLFLLVGETVLIRSEE